MQATAKQEYDKMNWMYSTFYGEMTGRELSQLAYVESHRELLNRYDGESIKILDCACGNGVQATALALNGYDVTATDISGEMVRLTNQLAAKHHARIKTAVKAWSELPDLYKEQFDIVLCTGNSIVHSPDAPERERNIASLKAVLRPQGTLVIETRNWDKLLYENRQFTVYDKVSYKDCDYIPLYHWRLNGMERPGEVGILFQEIGKDNHVELYESALCFTPFTHGSLILMMEKLGMETVKDTFDPGSDWFVVYGKKA